MKDIMKARDYSEDKGTIEIKGKKNSKIVFTFVTHVIY